MVLLAVIVEPAQTVALSLIAFGSALMALGILLPRLVGPVRVSAQGLEAQLVSLIQTEASARGLSEVATRKVVQVAVGEATDDLEGWVADLVAEAASATDKAVDVDGLKAAMDDPIVRELLRGAGRILARQRANEASDE